MIPNPFTSLPVDHEICETLFFLVSENDPHDILLAFAAAVSNEANIAKAQDDVDESEKLLHLVGQSPRLHLLAQQLHELAEQTAPLHNCAPA
jgi:hypothetical protein